jgi:hypothetical protein
LVLVGWTVVCLVAFVEAKDRESSRQREAASQQVTSPQEQWVAGGENDVVLAPGTKIGFAGGPDIWLDVTPSKTDAHRDFMMTVVRDDGTEIKDVPSSASNQPTGHFAAFILTNPSSNVVRPHVKWWRRKTADATIRPVVTISGN